MKTVQVTDKFKIYVTNEIEQWRADTFWTKEPETIEWIKSFGRNDTFFDVGANIGIYSLYCASVHSENLIYSFEPARCNFIRMMQNIELNKFDNIIALPIGIRDVNMIDTFGLIDDKIGHSGSQINSITDKYYLLPIFSLDFWSDFDMPTHVKIDIDGMEMDVIRGMAKTLMSGDMKSCLVEINDNKDKIIKLFRGFGYTNNNRFNKLENHSSVRRAKEGIKAENVIFCRRQT
uniref:Putative methyltransferase n=1 Tax=viral metagenome TaxID=1070528 RepID=A0A6M3J6N9_9ZZZZ